MRLNLPIILLGIVLLCTFGPANAGSMGNVSSSELRQLFPGRLHGLAIGAIKVEIVALSGGLLRVATPSIVDTGRWSIRSGRLCISLRKILKNRVKCELVSYRDGWYRTALVSFKPHSSVALR